MNNEQFEYIANYLNRIDKKVDILLEFNQENELLEDDDEFEEAFDI
mgnify:CR=1 FL=1